jgi:DNA-binding NarL/FixJ family response regulator
MLTLKRPYVLFVRKYRKVCSSPLLVALCGSNRKSFAMLNVLLVDDHAYMRRLLREMLETYPNVTVVGEAENGEDALLQAAALQPAVVILDIHLPKMNGIQATKLLKLQNPSLAVVGLTAGAPRLEETELLSAAGAAALLNKADVIDALYPTMLQALTRVQHPV